MGSFHFVDISMLKIIIINNRSRIKSGSSKNNHVKYEQYPHMRIEHLEEEGKKRKKARRRRRKRRRRGEEQESIKSSRCNIILIP